MICGRIKLTSSDPIITSFLSRRQIMTVMSFEQLGGTTIAFTADAVTGAAALTY